MSSFLPPVVAVPCFCSVAVNADYVSFLKSPRCHSTALKRTLFIVCHSRGCFFITFEFHAPLPYCVWCSGVSRRCCICVEMVFIAGGRCDTCAEVDRLLRLDERVHFIVTGPCLRRVLTCGFTCWQSLSMTIVTIRSCLFAGALLSISFSLSVPLHLCADDDDKLREIQ